MKKKIFLSVLACSLLLQGCSFTSPVGTVHVEFSPTETTDDFQFIDSDGNVTKLDPSDITVFVDDLLDSVDIPNGGSTAELKDFVYTNLEKAGIDLNNLVSEEDKEQAEQIIKDSLEEQGVDTSDLDIDLSNISEEE